MKINDKELQIFSRHLILKEFNEKSFNALQKEKVTIVGIGGIGCIVSQYLACAGIKFLKIIDSDVVTLSNLNRQTLYSLKDLGKSKIKIAKKKLLGINSRCRIESVNDFVRKKNINKYLKNSSLIIDATDNWNTMILINNYCVKNSIPLISSSAIGFEGQVTFFKNTSKKHLCLQCIFPNKNEPDLSRCDTVGIFGTAAAMAGLIAAQKTINFFLGEKENDVMTMIDIKSLKIDNFKIKKNKNCQFLKELNLSN